MDGKEWKRLRCFFFLGDKKASFMNRLMGLSLYIFGGFGPGIILEWECSANEDGRQLIERFPARCPFFFCFILGV
jgi:hypothetical protein